MTDEVKIPTPVLPPGDSMYGESTSLLGRKEKIVIGVLVAIVLVTTLATIATGTTTGQRITAARAECEARGGALIVNVDYSTACVPGVKQ